MMWTALTLKSLSMHAKVALIAFLAMLDRIRGAWSKMLLTAGLLTVPDSLQTRTGGALAASAKRRLQSATPKGALPTVSTRLASVIDLGHDQTARSAKAKLQQTQSKVIDLSPTSSISF